MKRKCYSTPVWQRFCDGCKSNSTKCPYRNKTRDQRHEQRVETYGELGIDEDGEPMVMTAEEAFKIIADDFFSRGVRRKDEQ